MTDHLTRQGARRLTKAADALASAVQNRHALLGIPEDVAHDFAKRCDLISDAVELTAATNDPLKAEADPKADASEVPDGKKADDELLRRLLAEEKMAAPEFAQPAVDETSSSVEPDGEGYDANAIADDRGGPYKAEGDEPYMGGEFDQSEFHQLRDKQEAGQVPGVDGKLAADEDNDWGFNLAK